MIDNIIGPKVDLFKKDVRSFMRFLGGEQPDGGTTNKYCFVDVDNLPDVDAVILQFLLRFSHDVWFFFAQWAEGQVDEDSNSITLISLTTWEATFPYDSVIQLDANISFF
jgi:hypothetical protein